MCSTNMYKRKFKKWGWAKYSNERHGALRTHIRASKTSCRRDLDLRRNALNLTFTADGMVEAALFDIKFFIDHCFATDARWKDLGRFDSFPGYRIRTGMREILAALEMLYHGNRAKG